MDHALMLVLQFGSGEIVFDESYQSVKFRRMLEVVDGHFAENGHGILIRLCGRHSGHDCVSIAKLGLQMLTAAEAFEFPIDHDGHSGAKRFAFFHA